MHWVDAKCNPYPDPRCISTTLCTTPAVSGVLTDTNAELRSQAPMVRREAAAATTTNTAA